VFFVDRMNVVESLKERRRINLRCTEQTAANSKSVIAAKNR